MLDLFFEEGWSKQRIVDDPRFNRSPHTLDTLIREAKRMGRTRKKITYFDKRARENWEVVSAAHAKLGVLISRYMSAQRINTTQFGLRVNMTRNQVAMLQAGAYDPKLSQVFTICKLLDVPPEELLQGMHNGPIRAPVA